MFLYLLMSAASVLSQPRNLRDAQKLTDLMQERLTLSSKQYDRVLEINLEAAAKASKALEQTSDQTLLKQKLESIRDQIDTSLLEILSSVQWKEWTELDGEMVAQKSQI
jgi:hypothetical protein